MLQSDKYMKWWYSELWFVRYNLMLVSREKLICRHIYTQMLRIPNFCKNQPLVNFTNMIVLRNEFILNTHEQCQSGRCANQFCLLESSLTCTKRSKCGTLYLTSITVCQSTLTFNSFNDCSHSQAGSSTTLASCFGKIRSLIKCWSW